MRSILFWLTVTVVFHGGCAFRPETEPGAPTGGEGNGLEPSEPVATLRVAWWLDERTKSQALTRPLQLLKEERLLRSSAPLTLPAVVPDRLEVELAVPTKLAELSAESVAVHWRRGSERPQNLVPRQIQVVSSNGEVTVLLLDLPGVRGLLPDGVESSGQLRLQFQKATGEVLLTLTQELRTAPALLEFTQSHPQPEDFEGLTEREVRSFELAALRFDLLQVVRIKNLSSHPVSVKVPVRSTARVRVKRIRYIARPSGPCGLDAWVEFPETFLSTDSRLLVLSSDIPRLAAKLAADPSSVNETEVRLTPGAVARIGIYFSGQRIQTLGEGRYEGAKPGRTRLPSHCESRCDKKRTGASEFPLCWGQGRNRLFNVPDWQIQHCLECGNGNQKGCDSCAGWENRAALYLRAGPNCLFCGELVEIGRRDDIPIYRAVPQWRTEQVWTDALVGDEDKSVLLEADPASAPLVARFADVSAENDPEGRALPFLKAAAELVGNR